jgi:hypothetical protein
MTDLVERLRQLGQFGQWRDDGVPSSSIYNKSADRIDELETALRQIIKMYPFKGSESDTPVDLMYSINVVARAALGEKNND